MFNWATQTEWLGNPVLHWGYAAIGALLGFVVISIIAALIKSRLSSLRARYPNSGGIATAAATAAATRKWILLLLAAAVALHALELGAKADVWIVWTIGALIGIQVAFWISRLLQNVLCRATTDGEDDQQSVAESLITWAVELVVWITVVLILLSNAGINVNAFIASLGVGGIAVALAAKNVLSDLLASIAIALDKPFDVGDFITFGDELGTVKRVGIKTTRITALSGEELIVGNATLQGEVLHNLSRRTERRVVFGFSVALTAKPEQIEDVVATVRGFIEAEARTRLDRGHFLAIQEYGYALEFVYYVLDPGYGVYADIQQRINLQIMRKLAALGLELAVPVRDLRGKPMPD